VTPLRSVKVLAVLAVLALGSLLVWHSARDPVLRPPVRQDSQDIPAGTPARKVAASEHPPFDFYLLALTLHAAFCADGHADQADCRLGSKRPLAIHGLWPERLAPGTWPHDCPAPRLRLDQPLADALREYMPGMAVGLHEHQWREHGGCSGLDADVYFMQALALARDLDAALSPALTTLAGGEATGAQIRAAADAFRPGTGATFTLHCRNLRDAPAALRNRPFLVEIRQCAKIDEPGLEPAMPFDCARANRRDQGCGASFRIATLPR